MDIFKFAATATPTKLEGGEIINGFKSKMWIERYSKAGEFEFVADASSGIREKLPVGSLISHVDSNEVMIVENHEISDDRESESQLITTGRGFETYVENRIVGSNVAFPSSARPTDHILANDYSWNQVATLLNTYITAASLVDDDNVLPYVSTLVNVVGASGTSEERTSKIGDLYSGLLDLLKIDDIGVKIIRPGPWSPTWNTTQDEDIVFMIHNGVDRSNEIIFSYDTGEIESADYLWSIKALKNAALITGKWVQAFVTTGPTGYNRRVMYVDGSEFDEQYESTPTAQIDTIRAQMEQKGLSALAAQKEVALAKAEVSQDANNSRYRKDFELGDIITVSGGYSTSNKQRISEYVEIEDQNGFRGYPTLTTIEES